MSKVICEVCGTAYPETALQCPICGCVRPADVQGIPSVNDEAAPERKYEHVKGGRFSKSNVRKRNTGVQPDTYSAPAKQVKSAKPATHTPSPADNRRKKKKKKYDNTGLVITILVLLLAIIVVFAYIAIKWFAPSSAPAEVPVTDPPVITEAPIDDVLSDDVIEELVDIPCVDIVLDSYEVNLENAGDHVYLGVTLDPFDTTDELLFESENNSVAMAEADGRITAVRKGETVVTVSCGVVSVQCKVTVGVPKEKLELNRQEIIFEAVGDTWTVYSGNLPFDKITWSSDDETVATVEDGLVTAVGSGVTTIYGNYNGQIQSCVVRCNFVDETVATPTDPAEIIDATEATEAETQPASSEYKTPFKLKNLWGGRSDDVSLDVGKFFELALVDSNGKHIKGVTWTVEDGSSCTVNDGTVRAVRSGKCTIVATYGGETYKCIIRVK